mgnify:CR=1 FL=1
MPKNIIGAQLRRLRYSKDLTQGELAARCGVAGFDISRGTLSKIEAGLRCVSDKELILLAKALRVPIDQLFENRVRKAKSGVAK